ncbi:MAG: hypothetical protein PF480_05275 [Roseovarius sp.]|nr:hypothetical protein [Roseovarius sp.]
MMRATEPLYQWNPSFCIDLKALDFDRVNLVGDVTGYHDFPDLNVVLKSVVIDLTDGPKS